MIYQILLFALTVVLAIILILLLRSHKIKEKYVSFWLFLDISALIVLLLPSKIIDNISHFLGFTYASNMVFTGVMTILVITTIQQAVNISKIEEERRILTEELAIMQNRVDALESKVISNRSTDA
ncbi:DUF2304 domain-containing protein [Actinomyces sp. zg-332]|uniref:DUF2304 domain-containing protein n=1 Tax=Actinomyces sp. zg-332 TaxID=2708340 RepID=UPI0014204C7A|nr:DUF2304 domain-containing protein [Actinomyces sp. zg-332]QPK93869.1 DUF2304 domain-containing protein [Actinomyces sp. zg-332]